MTPAGIEPATFRFVAQHLNHCATAVPQFCPVELVNVSGRYLLSFRDYSKVRDYALKAFLMLIMQENF